MDDTNISTIQQSAAEMMDRLKHLEPDDRYSLLEELGEWWFMGIDLEDILFIPDLEKML